MILPGGASSSTTIGPYGALTNSGTLSFTSSIDTVIGRYENT